MLYTKFEEVIKNLPPHFNNCRENILEDLDKYKVSIGKLNKCFTTSKKLLI